MADASNDNGNRGGPKVTGPSEHRALLLQTLEGVLEGRVNVPQANAVASLSGEVHRSIVLEWDMRCYAAQNLAIEDAQVLKLLEPQEG